MQLCQVFPEGAATQRGQCDGHCPDGAALRLWQAGLASVSWVCACVTGRCPMCAGSLGLELLWEWLEAGEDAEEGSFVTCGAHGWEQLLRWLHLRLEGGA